MNMVKMTDLPASFVKGQTEQLPFPKIATNPITLGALSKIVSFVNFKFNAPS
jgi:hypothetical protein